MTIELMFSGARLPFTASICAVAILSLIWLLYLVVFVSWRNGETIRHLIGESDPGNYGWEVFHDRFTRLPPSCSGSPAALRAKQLHDLRLAELEIDTEVSSAISQALLHGRGTVVAYAPTAVVLIGLMGTLYGLSDSVGTIKQALASLNEVGVEEVKGAVLAATEGMSTAFVTTFVGVVAAVVLGLALSLYRRWETATLAKLEGWVALYFLPACQTDDNSSIVESARALRRLQEDLSDGVTQLLDSFESRSNAISQLLTSRIEQSLAALQAESTQVLSAFRETVGHIDAVVGRRTDETPTLGEQAQMLATYVRTLDGALAEHRNLYRELDTRTQKTLEAQATLQVEENERLVALHNEIADRVTTAIGEYRRTQDQAEQVRQASLNRLAELINDVSNSVASVIDRGVREATDGLNSLRGLYAQLEEAQTQLAQRTQDLSEQVANTTAASDEQWQRIAAATEGLQQHVSEAGIAISALSRRLQDQLDTFQTQVQSGHDSYVAAIRAGQEGHVADVRHVMEQSDENLRTHYDRGLRELREAVASASTSIQAASDPICSRLDELREVLSSQRETHDQLIGDLGSQKADVPRVLGDGDGSSRSTKNVPTGAPDAPSADHEKDSSSVGVLGILTRLMGRRNR